MKNTYILLAVFAIVFVSCDDKIDSLELLNTSPELEYFSRSTTNWKYATDMVSDSAKVYNELNNANYSVALRAKDLNFNFAEITINESKSGGIFYIDNEIFQEVQTVEIDSFSLAFRYFIPELRRFTVTSTDDFGTSQTAVFEINFVKNVAPKGALELRVINTNGINEYVLDASNSVDGDASIGGYLVGYEYTIDGLVIYSVASSIKHVFSAGQHIISVRVQDSDGVWSGQITRTIII